MYNLLPTLYCDLDLWPLNSKVSYILSFPVGQHLWQVWSKYAEQVDLYCIQLRIEVHFFWLHWEMNGHWSRVNLVKREALLKNLNATSVLSFPPANKKVYFNPYIYAKAIKTRAPRGTDRSPEYNEHFCHQLDSRVKKLTTEWNQKQQHFITYASR